MKKITSIILSLLVGVSIFAAPGIKEQSKIIKEQAPKSAYFKADKNIQYLGFLEWYDTYAVRLESGDVIPYLDVSIHSSKEVWEDFCGAYGRPVQSFLDNKEIDKNVAKLTKVCGMTCTMGSLYIVVNSYIKETGKFQTVIWYNR